MSKPSSPNPPDDGGLFDLRTIVILLVAFYGAAVISLLIYVSSNSVPIAIATGLGAWAGTLKACCTLIRRK